MVHLLPHERFDLYKKAVSKLIAMVDCLSDLTSCINNDGSTCQEKNKLPKVIKDNGNPMISRKEPQPEMNLLVTENVNENSPHNVDKSNENILKSKTISTKTNQKIDSKQECKKKTYAKMSME